MSRNKSKKKSKQKSVINLWSLSYLVLAFLFFVGPFLFSGDWSWDQGWIFSITIMVFTIISRLIGNIYNPGLQRERLTASTMKGVKEWDKYIVPMVAILLPIVIVSVAGLNKRFGWSGTFAGWVHWFGFALVILGFAGGTWALASNKFFSTYVRIQKERGHQTVTTGPYAIIRHPGYFTNLVVWIGVPLMLDSPWAFLPLIAHLILLVIRTKLEDDMLMVELPGYIKYASHVHYRIIPGIW